MSLTAVTAATFAFLKGPASGPSAGRTPVSGSLPSVALQEALTHALRGMPRKRQTLRMEPPSIRGGAERVGVGR